MVLMQTSSLASKFEMSKIADDSSSAFLCHIVQIQALENTHVTRSDGEIIQCCEI